MWFSLGVKGHFEVRAFFKRVDFSWVVFLGCRFAAAVTVDLVCLFVCLLLLIFVFVCLFASLFVSVVDTSSCPYLGCKPMLMSRNIVSLC